MTEAQIFREHYRFFILTMQRNRCSADEIHRLLQQAWGDKAPGRSTVYRIFKEYSEGERCESFADESRSGRPSSVVTEQSIELVKNLIETDNRLSVMKIAQMLNISHGSVHTILKEKLQLRSLCSRWIPKDLTDQQRMARVEKAHEPTFFLLIST